MIWTNGQVYQGKMEFGKYQGLGTMTYPDGSISTGNWEKGRKHGEFKQVDMGGKISQVEWYMGKRAKPLIQFRRRNAQRLRQE